jgi:hypothetical protein
MGPTVLTGTRRTRWLPTDLLRALNTRPPNVRACFLGRTGAWSPGSNAVSAARAKLSDG